MAPRKFQDKKKHPQKADVPIIRRSVLSYRNVNCVQAFPALFYLIANRIILANFVDQARAMYKNFGIAIRRCNEAKTFCLIEKFYCSLLHLKKLTSKNMEKFTELLGYLDNSQQKIKSIANELVQSRWADMENRSPVETIDLENIFEDVKLTLAQQISETKASIFSRLEVSEVSMSRRSLRSIIYNLVGNAIKYRSPDRRPEIAITSRRENNFILIGIFR